MGDDLISRKEALDLIEQTMDECEGNETVFIVGLAVAFTKIDSLPSAERHGEWIVTNPKEPEIPVYECSVCNRVGCVKAKMNYCPNCGAHMMDGKEEDHESKV